MRFVPLLALLVGCGNDHGIDVDAKTGNFPQPRVIAGGGIGDGPIDGLVNLYLIDEMRRPVAGASVTVGTASGQTDATGLFVARDLKGPQTVVADVDSLAKRVEIWVGANGANMTIPLVPRDEPAPASAVISGSITDYDMVTVPAGHSRAAIVAYSQTDALGGPENSIAQPAANKHICPNPDSTALTCNFQITTRDGKVALVAVILDHDPKTADPNDDTFTPIRWAWLGGLSVTGGANQTGKNLALIPAAMQQTVTVAFGTPKLPTAVGVVGIELGADGVFALPVLLPSTATSLLAPKLEVFGPGTRYRFTGISTGDGANAPQSFVLRKHLTGTTLDAGEWLAPPTAVTATTTGASWTNAPGATVHSVELRSGATRALNVTMFDGKTMFTIPSSVSIPTGSIVATVSALGAPGLDLGDFALDTDFDKIVQFAAQPADVQ